MNTKLIHKLLIPRLHRKECTKRNITKLWNLIFLMEERKPGIAEEVLNRSEQVGFNYWYQSLWRQHQDNQKGTQEEAMKFGNVPLDRDWETLPLLSPVYVLP